MALIANGMGTSAQEIQARALAQAALTFEQWMQKQGYVYKQPAEQAPGDDTEGSNNVYGWGQIVQTDEGPEWRPIAQSREEGGGLGALTEEYDLQKRLAEIRAKVATNPDWVAQGIASLPDDQLNLWYADQVNPYRGNSDPFSEMFRAGETMWERTFKELEANPERLVMPSVTPLEAKVTGKITGEDYAPLTTQTGNPNTEENVAAARAEGHDPSVGIGAGMIADQLAYLYGGAAAGNALGLGGAGGEAAGEGGVTLGSESGFTPGSESFSADVGAGGAMDMGAGGSADLGFGGEFGAGGAAAAPSSVTPENFGTIGDAPMFGDAPVAPVELSAAGGADPYSLSTVTQPSFGSPLITPPTSGPVEGGLIGSSMAAPAAATIDSTAAAPAEVAAPVETTPVEPGGAMDMGEGGSADLGGGGSGGYLDGLTKFIGDNKLLSVMGLNAIANAFKPDAVDVVNARAEAERVNEAHRRGLNAPNYAVGGLQLGMKPKSRVGVLRDSSGAPVYQESGLISRAMRRA